MRVGSLFNFAGLAQLEEHLICNQDVMGSSPLTSILVRMADWF